MVDNIKGNFKSKHRRSGGEKALICDYKGCEQVETQSHCMVCPQWASIRDGLDLTKIDDLATFFQKLLLARAKLKTGSKIELHSKTPVPVESAYDFIRPPWPKILDGLVCAKPNCQFFANFLGHGGRIKSFFFALNQRFLAGSFSYYKP